MVIMYFFGDEIFDIFNTDFVASDDNNCFTKVRKDNDWNNNSYGFREILSSHKYEYKWNSRYIKCKIVY